LPVELALAVETEVRIRPGLFACRFTPILEEVVVQNVVLGWFVDGVLWVWRTTYGVVEV